MNKNNSGFSLIEMLVVLVLFSLLAVVATQTLYISLRSSRKAGNNVVVRENIGYAITVMDRHLKNAKQWKDCQKDPLSDTYEITFLDKDNNEGKFTCYTDVNAPESFYFASTSADAAEFRLTSEEVKVTSCTFTCDDVISPRTLEIDVEAENADKTGLERSSVQMHTEIYLRSN